MADEFSDLAKSLKAFNNGLYNTQMQYGIAQCNKFLSLVKPRTPVDTGALRSYWEVQPLVQNGGLYMHIKNDRDYATHVEYGHRVVSHGAERGYVEGRYMMTRTLADLSLTGADDYSRMIDELIERSGLSE